MREFIDARVKLLAVQRALRFDERRSPIIPVLGEVDRMEKYVHSLTAEFVEHYNDISRSQSVYEAQMKSALEKLAADNIGNTFNQSAARGTTDRNRNSRHVRL